VIRPYTRVRCADNTGARELSVIRVLASSTGTTAEIGDVFIAAVKNAIPNSGVKKGEVVRAVVVRQTKEYRRTDGSMIRFDATVRRSSMRATFRAGAFLRDFVSVVL